MAETLVARRFTLADYDRMVEAGIFRPDERLELLDGVVTAMTPIGFRHAACVDRTARRLMIALEGRAWVRVQGPVRLPDATEVVPDVAVLRLRDDGYAGGHALAGDVLAVIEVADTSLERDRDVKIPLYARARVPLVLVVDLLDEVLLAARQPQPGGYASITRLGPRDRVTLDPFPDVILAVAEFLSPPG